MIALQINNWNEGRKVKNEEKATIKSLKLEFEKNLIDLKGNIDAVNGIKSASELLLQYTGPDYTYGSLAKADSIMSITPRMSVWDPSLYTLSNIKNSGKLSNLSNGKLKLLLIEWESFYGNLQDWCDFYVERGHQYFNYIEANALNKNLAFGGQFKLGKSKFSGSNEHLLRLKTFENKLVNKVAVNGFLEQYYIEAKDKLESIIEQCEVYEKY